MSARGVGQAVEVWAAARLHLGFLDLDGGLGRRYGSLGLAIEGFGTALHLERAPAAAHHGPDGARAGAYLARAAAALGLPATASVTVREAIPEHVGLGSGTQLGLAVAAALARLHGIALSGAALAAAAGRGARSGIGIGAFVEGGFLVDGGRRRDEDAPPIIARLPFPADWRLLLTSDSGRSGLSGPGEQHAFAALPPFTEALAGRLCRLLVMRLLPGIAERDFAAVSDALAEIQERLGDYFAPVQSGRYSSAAVAAAQAWLAAEGIRGLGQSSWGPTGFALIESEAHGTALRDALLRRFPPESGLRFTLSAARNRGADITPS